MKLANYDEESLGFGYAKPGDVDGDTRTSGKESTSWANPEEGRLRSRWSWALESCEKYNQNGLSVLDLLQLYLATDANNLSGLRRLGLILSEGNLRILQSQNAIYEYGVMVLGCRGSR